jgi:hypothetical protein
LKSFCTFCLLPNRAFFYRNATGFPIKEPKADFVVFARLNLDSKTSKDGERLSDCYVFPAAVVRRVIEVGPSGDCCRASDSSVDLGCPGFLKPTSFQKPDSSASTQGNFERQSKFFMKKT